MKKSVYSLVLSDDVVEAVDRAAYQNGLSRSAMVNQILADYVSYTTPEKRMREIFSQVESLLTDGGVFQTLLQPSDSMMSLRSSLAYKYNPNVRYSVELYPGTPTEGVPAQPEQQPDPVSGPVLSPVGQNGNSLSGRYGLRHSGRPLQPQAPPAGGTVRPGAGRCAGRVYPGHGARTEGVFQQPGGPPSGRRRGGAGLSGISQTVSCHLKRGGPTARAGRTPAGLFPGRERKS